MKKDKKTLIICIAIPLAVGVAAGFLSGGGIKDFAVLNKPPLSPPGWLFPIVWTILYVLMGIASYLVLTARTNRRDVADALILYGCQLAANFLWPIFFFRFEWYLFSFAWLVLLWVLIYMTTKQFYEISKEAAYLMIPYLIWVTFAGYLNLGIWWLN